MKTNLPPLKLPKTIPWGGPPPKNAAAILSAASDLLEGLEAAEADGLEDLDLASKEDTRQFCNEMYNAVLDAQEIAPAKSTAWHVLDLAAKVYSSNRQIVLIVEGDLLISNCAQIAAWQEIARVFASLIP